jgi:hypothetical protein
MLEGGIVWRFEQTERNILHRLIGQTHLGMPRAVEMSLALNEEPE